MTAPKFEPQKEAIVIQHHLRKALNDYGYEIEDDYCLNEIIAGLEKAYAQGKEDAAKIAEKSLEHYSEDKDGNKYWVYCSDVSAAIRGAK